MATAISQQAGLSGRVIDLHGEPWQSPPRSPDTGPAATRQACCPDCVRYDRWVATLGGYASSRYIALCNEAREMAGHAGQFRYLNLAREVDEEHAAAAGGWLAREIELANAESTRRAEQAARQAAENAAAGILQRGNEIKLAVQQLHDHPRLAADPDFSAGPGMGSAEIAHCLRMAMGLTSRPQTPYEESLPPVADLGRRMGVRR